MSDRFTTWIDRSGEDRSEIHCRDNVTGKETSRPDGPRGRAWVDEWKREQLAEKERAA